MISKETYNMIQEYKKIGLTRFKTSEKLEISYRKVCDWWNKTPEEFESAHKPHDFILDNYREYIIDQLKVCPQISGSLINLRLRQQFPEFDVPMASFYKYLRNLREQTGLEKPSRRHVMRDEPDPGYEGQVDFGQYVMNTMYGNTIRVYFFCMVLSYSRMKYAYFSTEPFTTKMAIQAHRYAFKYFGGRPQLIFYDNDRTFMIARNTGDIIFVKEFEEFIRETGFSVYFCQLHDPDTKGKVEKSIDYIKRSFLAGRVYSGIDQLNNACLEWLDGVGNGMIHSYTRKTPREMFKREFRSLIKVYEKPNTDVMILSPENSAVEYCGNFYKLPPKLVANDERLRVERHENTLFVYYAVTNDLICRFDIPEGVGNIVSTSPQERQAPSIEEELYEFYKGNDTAMKYLGMLRKQKTSCVFEQMKRIRRLSNYYTEEQITIAMTHCILVGDCSNKEITSYLLYRYGEETARKFLQKNVMYHFRKRAMEIKEEQNNGR